MKTEGKDWNDSINGFLYILKKIEDVKKNNHKKNEEVTMIKLTDKDLKAIERYCGYDYVQRYRGILKRNSDNIVRVVNTGMVSSGKSSLFNILIDSTEEERFPTGAARTTKLADYYDYKNISFIDTPGIDVRNEDDALAFSTIMESDIIIMVHNIRTGPINRSEAEWLDKIVAGMKDAEMCKSRLIFVCTWKDTRQKDEDYQDIISDVKNMVFDIVGTEIPFFDVSVKKYLNGVSKNKQVLVESSGIPELRDYLEKYAVSYLETKQNIDRVQLFLLLEKIKAILEKEKTVKNQEVLKIKNRVKERYKFKHSAWKQVFQYFLSSRRQLSSLENELKNI